MRAAGWLLAVGFGIGAAAWHPVAAQDRCERGGSEKDDRRALAALRSAVEAACPCGSYTGAPGNDRAAYLSCMRPLIDAAVAAGELRTECRRRAERILRAATCGSAKVACGEYRSGAGRPATCRLKSEVACADTWRAERNRCAQTHCVDVEEFTAATCVDPRRPGPFGTGVRIVPFTKESARYPGQSRTLDTFIWYPTDAGASPLHPQYRGVVDAPLERAGAPYPLLMFSHGSCGYAFQSTFLTSILASHGFIVVSPPHPGNVLGEGCGRPQNQVDSAVERPEDIRFVLDRMLDANADSGSPFFGSIDPARLGMSGHSFGGLTTYIVAQRDRRYRVFMPMAPAALINPVLAAPSLTLIGAIDSVVDNADTIAGQADDLSPAFLVSVHDAGHYAFSDGCFPSPDCNFPATLSQDEAHDIVLRWAVPFLKVYLAGDDSFRPFLESRVTPLATVEKR